MENWGLITYRTTALLFDEKTSDAKYRNRIAFVVAHELAHQWFGNLVTMVSHSLKFGSKARLVPSLFHCYYSASHHYHVHIH